MRVISIFGMSINSFVWACSTSGAVPSASSYLREGGEDPIVALRDPAKLVGVEPLDHGDHRSCQWEEAGFLMHMIKKNYGAIVHMAVSTRM